MALRIEGEIEGLRNEQINFISDVLKKHGFTSNRVVFESVGQSGDNYVANVKRISVIVEDGKDFKIIAKFAPQLEELRIVLNSVILFTNEAIMYEKILPKLVSLQKAAGVPEEEQLRYAECYGYYAEEPNEVLLLEDLKESNFVMFDKFTSLKDDAVRLIFKNFAILHSLSFALRKLEPETYNEFTSQLTDMWRKTSQDEQFKQYLAQLQDGAISVVDEKYKTVLKRGIVTQMSQFVNDVKKLECDAKHLAIQQGDGWTNNILFKVQNEKPTECVLIDYQLSHQANPVNDILYMTMNCTDHITRQKHFLDWIEYYHEQLARNLSIFGIDANSVYPKDQLDTDLKAYSGVHFGTSVVLHSMLTRKPEEAQAAKDAMKDREKLESQMALDNLSEDTLSLYKARIEDLIDSYQLFGYL